MSPDNTALFQRITENSQPHATYSRHWSATYRSLDFAEIFLPRARRRFGAGVLLYDAAELFTGIAGNYTGRSRAADGSPLSITVFSYAADVLAHTKKQKLVTADNEICCFVEAELDGTLALTFRFGKTVLEQLEEQAADTSRLERMAHRTTRAAFQAFFNGVASFEGLQSYILEIAGPRVLSQTA